mgnify:CR=1 FL=1
MAPSVTVSLRPFDVLTYEREKSILGIGQKDFANV